MQFEEASVPIQALIIYLHSGKQYSQAIWKIFMYMIKQLTYLTCKVLTMLSHLNDSAGHWQPSNFPPPHMGIFIIIIKIQSSDPPPPLFTMRHIVLKALFCLFSQMCSA